MRVVMLSVPRDLAPPFALCSVGAVGSLPLHVRVSKLETDMSGIFLVTQDVISVHGMIRVISSDGAFPPDSLSTLHSIQIPNSEGNVSECNS